MKEKAMQAVTKTAVCIALLVTVQWVTGFTGSFAGDYISDSCVNCILVVTVLMSGLGIGTAVAVLAPVCAFFLRVDPGPLQAVPAIALGNCAQAALIWALIGCREVPAVQKGISVAVSALVKFIVLYCAVVKVLIPVMGPALPAKQAAALTAAFSWPQLVTALIGTAAAVLLVPLFKKRTKK